MSTIDRTQHNLWNSSVLGFSGNDLHMFMDRGAKSLRHKHRQIGHDKKALRQMLILFKDKYTADEIIKTFVLHIYLDSAYDSVQATVRQNNKYYGKKKKKSVWEQVQELRRKVNR